MTADKIINLLLSEFKTDQAGFAKMIGVHKSTISNILNRHTKSISSNVAQRIVQLRPEINYDFLIGKSDEMKTDVTDSVESQSKVFMKTLGRGKISIREIT